MKNKFTILGCGSSLGSPWITSYTGKLKKNSKNQRTRCCAHIQKGNLSVLIDTSPDIKHQFLKNKIKTLDSIIYTHEHADQTAGIFEMRPFYWKNKSKIPIYGSSRTIRALKKSYKFCFVNKQGWPQTETHIFKTGNSLIIQPGKWPHNGWNKNKNKRVTLLLDFFDESCYSKKAYDEYYKKYDNAFKLEQLVRTYEQRKVA